MVNGRSVASRKGGLVAKLLNRPWPKGDDVVAAVQEALQANSGSGARENA